MWKGNKVGYGALHEWIKNHKPKPKVCENCKKNKPYDLANISGKYTRNIKDYKWLCRKCHMQEDGRLKKFIQNNQNREKKEKKKYYCLDCKKEIGKQSERCYSCANKGDRNPAHKKLMREKYDK